MTNTSVILDPVKVVLGPLGFHGFATKFLEATKFVNTTNKFSPVPYYLYCRAIELSLKAFLLTKGVSLKKLKKNLGHNLVKILSEAKSKSIEQIVLIIPEEEEEIRKANKYYNSKGFEYFQVINAAEGYPELPQLSILAELAKRLVNEIEQPCSEAISSRCIHQLMVF